LSHTKGQEGGATEGADRHEASPKSEYRLREQRNLDH